MSPTKLIVSGIIALVLMVGSVLFFDIKTIEGNQFGIRETWGDGVQTNVLTPKTYILCTMPGFSEKIFTYDANIQTLEFNDYKIQAADNQDVTITSRLQWRRDFSKLHLHHTQLRDKPEQRIITPTMARVIKDKVTMLKAIEGYSGEGLVRLQQDIETALRSDQELQRLGIQIDSYAIIDSNLDPEYIKEIHGRQIATQKQLRAVEEEKAAQAEALVQKAKAQADYNRALVEAQRDKEVGVLSAEKQNEQTILAAKAENEKSILGAQAEKEKLILEAEGKRQAAIAEAEGILALGKSKAEAQKLQLQAYAVEGADAFVKVEVAKQLAEGYKNIKGYLPETMSVNLLTDNFGKAVDILTGNPVLTPAKK